PHPRDRGRGRPGEPEPLRVRGPQGERGPAGRHLPLRGPARRRGRRRMKPASPGSWPRPASSRRPWRRAAAALLAAVSLSACATSGAFRAGEQAERRQDYDRAVLEYSRAVKQDPDNLTYRKGLERAKLRAAEAHTVTARDQARRGLYKEALDEYRLALDLKPDSPTLWTEMQDVESR